MRILITRPEEDAAEFAMALNAAGHEPVLCPLLHIVLTAAAPLNLEGAAALIATSRNGLRGLARSLARRPPAGLDREALMRLPIFCVGSATAGLAQEMGFAHIYSGAGGARDLIPLIETHIEPASGLLVHFGGEQLAFDLPGALAQRGYRTRLEALYRTESVAGLPPPVIASLKRGEIGGVVLMSPRTARIFVGLLQLHGLVDAASHMVCYCLSPAVAQALGASGEFAVRVAQKPNARDILALVEPARAHWLRSAPDGA
jgi:uroporphyrinogen-III synthase